MAALAWRIKADYCNCIFTFCSSKTTLNLSSGDRSGVVNYNSGLESLLMLDGEEYTDDKGYKIRIQVVQVKPDTFRPHGLKYNMVLLDNYGQRVFGMDNAHAIKVTKGNKFNGYVYHWDHKHLTISDKGTPYHFSDAGQLMEDFFKGVDHTIHLLEGEG